MPEPKLAPVTSAAGEIAGYLVANGRSSRSIKASNPLHLPQAKTFDDALGLSDAIMLVRELADPCARRVDLKIIRDGVDVFVGEPRTRGCTAGSRTWSAVCCGS